jgi:hypothetical protein
MFDSSLMSLLPDAYEGLEILTAIATEGCRDGFINLSGCRRGQNYSSCSCGDAYGAKS